MNHFFDVGANVGQTFGNYLAKTTEFDGWPVWCFEPSPRHWGQLMQTTQQFSNRYNIILCPFGLYGATNTALFYEKNDPEGDSLFHELTVNTYVTNRDMPCQILVSVLRISDFILARIPPEDRVVLKLDAEGVEYSILQDLLKVPEALNRVSRIIIEWHTVNEQIDPNALAKTFADLGKPLENWI